MTVKQLRAFLALASTLNFAEAAAKLCLSQPALSLLLKNLEQRIGGRLFNRNTRQVNLTAEGAAFLATAKTLLANWEDAEEELRLRFALQHGKLVLAAMPFFAATLLPELLGIFRQRFPQISIEVHDVLAERVTELVQQGRIELGITFEPEPATDLQFFPLYQDQFIAIVPADLVKPHTSLTWQQLLQHDFITLQQPSGIRRSVMQALAQAGIELQVSFEAHQLATVGRMVSSGLGVAVVPSLCRQQMQEQGVQCLAITEPAIIKTVGVLCQPRSRLSAAANAMLDVLLAYQHSEC